MTWALFLDDRRSIETDDNWTPMCVRVRNDMPVIIARSNEAAVDLIEQHGTPAYMYLDYDLGFQTSLGFLRWYVNQGYSFPKYEVISTHPCRFEIDEFIATAKIQPESLQIPNVGSKVVFTKKGKVMLGTITEVDDKGRLLVQVNSRIVRLYPTEVQSP